MDALRSIRRQRGLSQRELAEAAGVGQGTVSGLESGRQEARPSTLQKLAEALGVGVPDLLAAGPDRAGAAASSRAAERVREPVDAYRALAGAGPEAARLGISEADFPAWGYGVPAMETGADREEVLGRFGTPEELQENLEALARGRGATEEEMRVFRRACSPEAFARDAAEPGHLDGPDGLGDPEVRAAYDRVTGLLDSPLAGVGGRDLARRHRAYFSRMDPAGLRRSLGGLVVPGSRGYEEAFDRFFGFTGEPASSGTREERTRVEEIARRYPPGREEFARAAALTNGRGYRWPDERGDAP